MEKKKGRADWKSTNRNVYSRMHRLAVPPLIGAATENGFTRARASDCSRTHTHGRHVLHAKVDFVPTHVAAVWQPGRCKARDTACWPTSGGARAHARARLRLRDTLNKPWWGVKGGQAQK